MQDNPNECERFYGDCAVDGAFQALLEVIKQDYRLTILAQDGYRVEFKTGTILSERAAGTVTDGETVIVSITAALPGASLSAKAERIAGDLLNELDHEIPKYQSYSSTDFGQENFGSPWAGQGLQEEIPLDTRWQYAVVNVGSFNTPDRLATVLAVAGSNGWDLVSVYDKASNWFMGMEKGFMLLKRPVPPGVEVDEWCVQFRN